MKQSPGRARHLAKSRPKHTAGLFVDAPESQFAEDAPAAPFAWYGGKYYYARQIISLFPEHRVYVEPFGGAANILLRKVESEVEVFNDLDKRLVEFFEVLRSKRDFAELVRRSQLTPYSRDVFRQVVSAPEPRDKVGRAWAFFVRCRQSLGGIGMSSLTPGSWVLSLRTRRKMAETVSKFLSAIDGLEDVASRFRSVAIESLPAVDLIRKYDGADVFFYCDPPYLPETRHGGEGKTYGCEMTVEDHEALLDQLMVSNGKIMLSGYASDLYDNKLRDWKRETLAGKSHMANSGQSRTEVIWMNY